MEGELAMTRKVINAQSNHLSKDFCVHSLADIRLYRLRRQDVCLALPVLENTIIGCAFLICMYRNRHGTGKCPRNIFYSPNVSCTDSWLSESPVSYLPYPKFTYGVGSAESIQYSWGSCAVRSCISVVRWMIKRYNSVCSTLFSAHSLAARNQVDQHKMARPSASTAPLVFSWS